jgi:hypothetical protein
MRCTGKSYIEAFLLARKLESDVTVLLKLNG